MEVSEPSYSYARAWIWSNEGNGTLVEMRCETSN